MDEAPAQPGRYCMDGAGVRIRTCGPLSKSIILLTTVLYKSYGECLMVNPIQVDPPPYCECECECEYVKDPSGGKCSTSFPTVRTEA